MDSQPGLLRDGVSTTLGEMFRESPGKLLDYLESNLEKILLDREPKPDIGSSDCMPVFPCPISVADLNQFYGLMECEIFSNYVNLFLNLPLFSRLINVAWTGI